MTTSQAFALALQHHQTGRLAEAEALYRQILALQPNHAGSLHHLGMIAHQLGRHDLAVELISQAIAFCPQDPAPLCNLGLIYATLGRLDEAFSSYRRALELNPNDADVHSNMGIALRSQGRLEEAVVAYRRALELQPDYPEVLNNLGSALRDQGQFDAAIAAFHRALQLKPDYAEAHNNLGIALSKQGRWDESIAAHRRALQINPNSAAGWNDLGASFHDQRRWEDAMASFRRAIVCPDGSADAHFNLGLLFLLLGRYEEGWREHEWRWRTSVLVREARLFSAPQWDGSPVAGRTILIHAEQGFGDTLQFVRYASLVARLGARVIVECQPGLKTLLAGIEGVSQVLERGEALPDFDLHCPMMSLPIAFGTRAETIPASIPYLHADPIRAGRWRERLDRQTAAMSERGRSPRDRLKVGLIWAGATRSHQPNAVLIDRRRSMRLSQFGPLAEVAGVVFVSLQKGPPATHAQTPPEGMTLLDWTEELHDFADTAALVEALDLIISVDTAGAHLAGALGKPVWVLSRFDGCWRWLLDRADSPWYPTMRLFRQSSAGDWDSVIRAITEELGRMIEEAMLKPMTSLPQ